VHDDGLACHGDDGASLLTLAVVRDDDVTQARRELGREALDLGDEALDDVVTDDDLALQASGVGEPRRERVTGVARDLADVVQQGAGDDEVAVHGRQTVGDGRRHLGDDHRVLEQAVAVRVMVAHRGRDDGEGLARLAVWVDGARKELRDVRLADAGDQRREPLAQLVQRNGRDGDQCRRVVLSFAHHAEPLDHELGAPLRVDAVAAPDLDDGPGHECGEHLVRRVEVHRFHLPRGVEQRQVDHDAAVAGRLDVALGADEVARHGLTVGEVGDEGLFGGGLCVRPADRLRPRVAQLHPASMVAAKTSRPPAATRASQG